MMRAWGDDPPPNDLSIEGLHQVIQYRREILMRSRLYYASITAETSESEGIR